MPQTNRVCFAGQFRSRLRTPNQVVACKRQTRFLLGLMSLLGLDEAEGEGADGEGKGDGNEMGMSLHLLGVPAICSTVLSVLDARGIRAQRRYQVLCLPLLATFTP